jgi:hypothetical protein
VANCISQFIYTYYIAKNADIVGSSKNIVCDIKNSKLRGTWLVESGTQFGNRCVDPGIDLCEACLRFSDHSFFLELGAGGGSNPVVHLVSVRLR